MILLSTLKFYKDFNFRIFMEPAMPAHSISGHFVKILLIFFLGLFLPAAGRTELVDKVVAVVNDDVITLSEVEEEAARIFQAIATDTSGRSPINSMEDAREIALNGLIDRRLINQRAKSANTTVSDEELAAAFENTRNRMAPTPAEFKKKLQDSGMTEESFKKQLRDQVLQSKLVSYDVRAKIVVTDEMIREYFNEHYASKTEQGSYYLLQMGFQWNPKTSDPDKLQEERTQAKKRAEKALEQVNKGQDFKEIAKKFSELPSAADGGDLGILHLDDMAPAMRTAIAPLQPGDISKIIETSDGFQFFKLLSAKDEAASASSPYEKVKDEIREKLHDEKLKAAYAEWVKKLKENAYIQKL
jgi:peptidyl-prolyl cis-trans isomerase SurA